MQKFGLIAALFACIFGFAACEEEKEELIDVQQVYYRLHSWADTENENIYIREYDKNDSCVLKNYIDYLGKSEYSEYRMAKPNTDYVTIYWEQTYYGFDGLTYKIFAKMKSKLDRTTQYNDLFLTGEEITEQEFREIQEQKK